jgi:hypothetical protein
MCLKGSAAEAEILRLVEALCKVCTRVHAVELSCGAANIFASASAASGLVL